MMKHQSRAGKILESLSKRRKFSEAWDLPDNLRDKKYIKQFLSSTKVDTEFKKRIGHSPTFEDLSNFIDYKTKKLGLKVLKDLIRDNYSFSGTRKAMGILLEYSEGTLFWLKDWKNRNSELVAYLIGKDGTIEEISESDVQNYTGRAAKATKGYMIFNNTGYEPNWKKPNSGEVDPLNQVDYKGNRSTLFSKTKDGLVNLMKLRKALTKIKMEPTKESVLANVPKIEKIMKSGIGVELTLDGETYLLFSENNNLPSDYKTRISSRLWPLTSDDPRDKREIVLGNGGVFRMNYFFNSDLKQSRAIDSRGMGYHFVIYLDEDTDEIKLWKNYKWSKYRGY